MAIESSQFRQLLEAREVVVVDAIRQHLDDAGREHRAGGLPDVMDTKDSAFRDTMNTIRQAGLIREAEELEDIRGALARIDAGRYGVCIVCGEHIPEARLKAWPTAKRCRPCQEEREAEKRRGH
ncbi:TraR/DksA family transcriptional regulator [Natronospira bacteriovora]|uniref:TraR/DksA C4-type zinc finger protein n=1 Tax=Natronospira bacteriovora TaxID=3069753 RepID=A0ABU0W537_9GAMM|nr:TraR/DksA C4-type zinc finger protein [Natronospira sp. AB-CW4]MDQ2069023.1 TraR/DksA C4-type zinc finger protein [Natronospira sp. AB-CW4]